jgi:hypothetical protein
VASTHELRFAHSTLPVFSCGSTLKAAQFLYHSNLSGSAIAAGHFYR